MLNKYIPNEKMRNLAEWVIAIVFAVIVYWFLSNYVYSSAEISGPSMNPTLEHGERVIVNRMAYWFSAPKRNDIIAFPYPTDPTDNYVKRVLGLPGDEIDIFHGKVYINGEELNDSFSPEEMMPSGDVVFPIIVGEGEYFVLGDNRDSSKDSRYSTVGCIKKENVIGKVSLRFWPIDRVGFVE
ncbi:MAG: signal peptidase I [Clostridiales bacterium]|jgi:signal peptidase I|nr:signal peptidase I [Clostridiales bacterium]